MPDAARHAPRLRLPILRTPILRMLAVACALVCGQDLGAAACPLAITDVSSTAWSGGQGRGYDVYDPRLRTQLVTLRLRSQDVDCPYVLTIAPVSPGGDGGGSLNGPGASLRFSLYKDAAGGARLGPYGAVTENEVFTGVVPAGRSGATLQFVVVVPPEQLVPPGLYSGDIELSAYEGSLGRGVLRDRRRVAVTASVPAVTQISFGEGSGFDADHNAYSLRFGTLYAGERRSVRLKVRANGGYRLRLESENGGRLRHVDPRDGSFVPFSLTVDGRGVDLRPGHEAEAAFDTQAVSSDGRQFVLEFVVGDIGDASAGDYRDVINVVLLSLR